ncbi:MAG: Rrf2 family transcriptional regulator [Rhodospirillales bacterium]|nr:Rrf2 family transcriptional regulator [Rhodospirillales bacterium]
MAHIGSGVEYGLHCLLYLVDPPPGGPPSSRDVAEFQGVSLSYVAKLFTALEKAGVVAAAEGIGGGYRLARPATEITVLDVVDAIEGEKPLFECREIRGNCVLFAEQPQQWATHGMCSINAVMRAAEREMRNVLRGQTLADLAATVATKIPGGFQDNALAWFSDRATQRRRRTGKKDKKERSA